MHLEYVYNIEHSFPVVFHWSSCLHYWKWRNSCHLGQSIFVSDYPEACMPINPSRACPDSLSIDFSWMLEGIFLVVKLLVWVSRERGDKHRINREGWNSSYLYLCLLSYTVCVIDRHQCLITWPPTEHYPMWHSSGEINRNVLPHQPLPRTLIQ